MTFYERVIQLLKEKKISQTAFLEQLGMGKNQLTQWKKGRLPYKSTLEAIARYFDVSVDYLLGKTDERKPDSQNEDEAIKVALFGGDKEVTPEMWQEVKDYIEFIKHKYFKDDDNAE